jgi:hypothetical protein
VAHETGMQHLTSTDALYSLHVQQRTYFSSQGWSPMNFGAGACAEEPPGTVIHGRTASTGSNCVLPEVMFNDESMCTSLAGLMLPI